MPPFRFNAVKAGLTYSCPVDKEDNPVGSCQDLLEWLVLTFGDLKKYSIGREDHKNGKKHFHAYLWFESKVNSTNVRVFDFKGVHPDIIHSPKRGWEVYCTKDKDYISNYWKEDFFSEARDKDTWAEASGVLWDRKPEFMFKYASQAEKNYMSRKKRKVEPRLYYGPHIDLKFPGWDEHVQALELVGRAGWGKTQWARYHCSFDGYFYCKGTLNCLKFYGGEPWIIFDDITHALTDCIALLDVENGGAIPARYSDYVIPPGVRRIFISNEVSVWPGYPAAINRRLFTHTILN